jgi:hypothetical protein
MMPNKTDAFFSGFMPASATGGNSSQLLTYTIRVSDTKPIWFYCSQGKHCQAGMVGAINAYVYRFLQFAMSLLTSYQCHFWREDHGGFHCPRRQSH